MKIKYLKQFRKDILKLNKKQLDQFKNRMAFFQLDPKHSYLNNHPLQGKLKGFFSINITGDIRAIYKPKRYRNELTCEFIRLGTHSELY